MDNSEGAFRIKPASDISVRVRKLNHLGAQLRSQPFDSYTEAQKAAILHQQVDELATAVQELAQYIARRDGIDLGG